MGPNRFKPLFLVILLFTLLVAEAFVPSKALAALVILDPGHGGSDRGAVRGELQEASIVLEVALLVQKHLLKDGIESRLTRTKDAFLSLEQRAQVAVQSNPALFLSIHANSSLDSRAQGIEFYFQSQLRSQEESMYLANQENEAQIKKEHGGMIQPRLSSQKVKSEVEQILLDLERTRRITLAGQLAESLYEAWTPHHDFRISPIRQAPFYLVSEVPAPSVLVELGYLSHPVEGPLLGSTTHQNFMAKKLARGIRRFLDSQQLEQKQIEQKQKMDKSQAGSLN